MKFKQWEVELQWKAYMNGRPALRLINVEDGELVLTASVNLPDTILEDNEIAIKDYSENTGVLLFLVKNKIVTQPRYYVPSGHVMIPICEVISHSEGDQDGR